MALAVLSIDLVAKMAKFEADMGKAARASQKTADQISSAFSVIKGAAGGLAGAFSIGALVTFTKATIDSIDALNDVADATGSSIENISALEDIAARTGTTMDTVSGALVKFNGVLKDAKPGSDAERSLTALGLSFKELQTLDPAEALRRTAVALSGFADDGNKARLVQDLFGKSVKESAPFLKDLAEQSKLVATVTKEQAAEAEKFNKELFAMEKNILDVGRSMAGPMVSAINQMIERYREASKEGKGFYTIIREEQLRMLGLNTTTTDYANQLATVNARLKETNPGFGARNALLKEQADLMAKLAKPVFPVGNAGRGGVNPDSVKPTVGVVPDKPTKPPGGGGAAARQSDADRYLESLQKQLERTQELSAVEQVMLDIGKKRLGNVTAAQESALLGIAKQIDAIKEQEAAEKRREDARNQTSKYFEGLAREQSALEESNTSLLENVEVIGLSKTAVNDLTLARIEAAIAVQREKLEIVGSLDASSEEIKLIERKIELLQTQKNLTERGHIAQGMADSAAKQEEASKDFAKTLENDMKGAFSAAFRDTKDPLGAFGDALANVIYSRAATALADSLTGSLFGGSAGGGILSGIGKAFGLSFDGGGYTGSGSRSGGLDGKGGFMAMLHPKETVIDHTKGQSAGGSVVVNQSFTVGDVASVTMVRQAVANSQRQLVAALGRSTNYGGAIA